MTAKFLTNTRFLLTLSILLSLLYYAGIHIVNDLNFHHYERLHGHHGDSGGIRNTIASLKDAFKKVRMRFVQRREHLIAVCKRNFPSADVQELDTVLIKNQFLKTALFFSDRYKILFCQIPKCGTRSQAKFLAALDGLISPEEMESTSEAKATSLIERRLSARRFDSFEQMKYKLQNYTKVIVVREPSSRILSAFRNKLENNTRNDGYANMARNLHEKYGNSNSSRRDREVNGAPVILFDDFLHHLINPESDAQVDQHWNFYNRLCSPCTLTYDYIIKMDTIDDDMAYLRNYFNVTHIPFPPSYNSFTDMLKVKQYFSNADPALVRALYNTYKLDYDLFGFPPLPTF